MTQDTEPSPVLSRTVPCALLDEKRVFKTALTTGVAGVVPTFGNPANSVLNAVGSLFIGFDATIINSTIEVIFTNIFK